MAIVLAVCLGGIAYAWLVYPAMIGVLSRLFGRSEIPRERPRPDPAPSMSLLIVAHNEAQHIDARLLNALGAKYPAGQLEIVVASDGSTDGTNEIVAGYEPDGVRLLAFPERRGKVAALNDALPTLRGDVVVFSDANSLFDQGTLQRFAQRFEDPDVGVVCGRLILCDNAAGRNCDGIYWKFETYLKKAESRLGALLGANGAIYAARRALLPPLPPATVVDDFVLPLLARIESGCRLVYDTQAVAREITPDTVAAEYQRRARIGAGNFQALTSLWPLLLPRHGWVSFSFFSHKIVRWLCPFFMIGAMAANLALATRGQPYTTLLAAQIVCYALAAAGAFAPAGRRWRWLRVVTLFLALNAALFVGFFRWLFRWQPRAWERTLRSDGAPTRQRGAFAREADGSRSAVVHSP